jgi:hypothetical protein
LKKPKPFIISRRGGTKGFVISQSPGRSIFDKCRDTSSVPSPTANLVGLVKKLRKSFACSGAILEVLRAFDFSTNQTDIRSSQRAKVPPECAGLFVLI